MAAGNFMKDLSSKIGNTFSVVKDKAIDAAAYTKDKTSKAYLKMAGVGPDDEEDEEIVIEASEYHTDWTRYLQKENEKETDDSLSNFLPIPYEGSLEKYPPRQKQQDTTGYMHAVHCMIYAEDPQGRMWTDIEKTHAVILMQMRFDGKLGFPGGFMDKEPGTETPTQALMRELQEEIGLDPTKFTVTDDDHVISHINRKRTLVLHFFKLKVQLDEIKTIERNTIDAQDWGLETFGTVRVPLFLFRGGVRGFPDFLTNKFAGSGKMQLIYAIQKLGLVPDGDFDAMMVKYKNYTESEKTVTSWKEEINPPSPPGTG